MYKTIILPVVPYGCETLREEHRLRVFENRVLRIFGPKRDEVMGEWRKLRNEELHDLYSSSSIISIINNQVEEDDVDGPCSRNGREEERV
jgi:hypothetical protein